MKILKGTLDAVLIILIVLSLIALIVVHWTLFHKAWLITPQGFENYITSLGNYKALFTSTVAVMAAYFGFHRLNVAIEANVQKVKQDRFVEWKTVLDIRFMEIEKNDPFMKREFVRIRHKFYEQLFPLKYNIDNQTQLIQIFDSTFRELVIFFEQQNNRHIGMGGPYPDNRYSYSFDSFRFLFLGCIDNVYNNIVIDLQNLYLNCLPGVRRIDGEIYRISVLNYKPVR